MLSTTRYFLRKVASTSRAPSSSVAWRLKSTSAPEEDSHTYAFDENGETAEFIEFPVSAGAPEEKQPVLLNAKEHAVGYLSKILNARVYDAAIETELQEAKNLSTVSWFGYLFPTIFLSHIAYQDSFGLMLQFLFRFLAFEEHYLTQAGRYPGCIFFQNPWCLQ